MLEPNEIINEQEGAKENQTETETKTFSEEEVLRLVETETSKRVSAALKTQEKKFQKQLSLSQLDDEARAKAEKDDRIAELEQQLAQFQIERNRSELKSVLSSRGLSAEFADLISIGEDDEINQANIDKLDKLFKKAVTAEVEKRLAGAGGAPKGNGTQGAEITKEMARKMTMAQLNELAEKQPEVFKKLFG